MKTFLLHRKNKQPIEVIADGFHIIERGGDSIAVFFQLYRDTCGVGEKECAAFKDFTHIEE